MRVDVFAVARSVRPIESFLPKYIMDLQVTPEHVSDWLEAAFDAGSMARCSDRARDSAIAAARALAHTKPFDVGNGNRLYVIPENVGDWLEAVYAAGVAAAGE